MNNTFTDGFIPDNKFKPKVKPVDKRGYKRSGMILFNNINQVQPPAARTWAKTRNDSEFGGEREAKNATAEPTVASTVSYDKKPFGRHHSVVKDNLRAS